MPEGRPSATPEWLNSGHPSHLMTMTLTATPASVGVARSQIDTICQRHGLDELRETATLLVSELVTNAITHGAGELTMSVACTDRDLSVGVTDESLSEPMVDHHPSTDRIGGRGLFLVETLATTWSYVVHPGGKTVWFCLDAHPQPHAAAG